MDREAAKSMLERVRAGELPVDEALEALLDLPFEDLGFAKVDHHRQLRTGAPEVVYGEGKSAEQIVAIAQAIRSRGALALVTRVTPSAGEQAAAAFDDATHDPIARTVLVGPVANRRSGRVAVVSAGTTDRPVASEAIVTLEALGHEAVAIEDVGVSGLHRIVAERHRLDTMGAVIVAAGMEGALASVVTGLISRPVIAVPTSVGYGASFGGIAALLGMLSSCAAGVAVVNIDNGFGAACVASRMLDAPR